MLSVFGDRSAPRSSLPAPGSNSLLPTPTLPPYASAVRIDHPPAIDGDLADWPGSAAQSVVLGPRSFVLTDTRVYHGARDLAARLRLAWDDSTLYVAGELTDDSVTAGDAWDTDRVNLVFDMKHDTSPLTYTSANPPLDQWQDDDYWLFWRFGQTVVRRFGKVNADPVPGARLATRRTREGWTFEAAIPRVTLATALISALTGRPVHKEVGMTGEITLRGRVLPVGGLSGKSAGCPPGWSKSGTYPGEKYERPGGRAQEGAGGSEDHPPAAHGPGARNCPGIERDARAAPSTAQAGRVG